MYSCTGQEGMLLKCRKLHALQKISIYTKVGACKHACEEALAMSRDDTQAYVHPHCMTSNRNDTQAYVHAKELRRYPTTCTP